jgi:hypothetical protein
VEQAEIEMLVTELEGRIDRLRSLYDMYFMGIERLEPLVPRKDVERRMAALRKEQIRNTGLRFKFNVIIQRFNTYQTYWLRISRQIEQGTYRRDVMRATARFGVDPTKERAASTAPAPLPPESEEVEEFEVSLEDFEDGADPLESFAAEDDPFAELGPPPAAPHSARERFASVVRLDLDDLADPFEEHDPFPKPSTPSITAPKIRIAPRAGGASLPAPSGEPTPQDTERRIPVANAPRIAIRSGTPPAPSPAPVPPAQASVAPPSSPRLNEAPRVIVAKRASMPDDLERNASVRPGIPSPPPSSPSIARSPAAPAAAPLAGAASSAWASMPRPSTAPRVASRQTGPSPAVSSPPAAVSKSPAASLPAPPRAAPAAPAAPGSPAAAPAQPRAPSPPPVVAAPAPVPAATPAVRVGDLSGDRFGQLFSKYVETRRERNEPTHAITREALAKQLSESTERLKAKHGGKAIDFEVVVKDGKTILRPVVK